MSISSSNSISSMSMLQYMLRSADTDKNNRLSLGEFKAIGQNLPTGTNGASTSAVDKLFKAIDSDRDGSVTESELSAFMDRFAPATRTDLLQIQEQFRKTSLEDLFSKADSDGNGDISFAEFKADLASHAPKGSSTPSDSTAKALFSAIDTDGNGTVSQGEFDAALEKRPPPHQSSSADLLALLAQATYSSSLAGGKSSSSGLTSSLLKAA